MRWINVLILLGLLAVNALTVRELKRRGPGENPRRYFRLLKLSKVLFVWFVVLLILRVALILLRPSAAEPGGLDDLESVCAGLMISELHPETSPEAREAFLKAREALCGPQ